MSERVQRRMVKNRKMTAISLRVPEDVISDLKEVAPTLGIGGYQALIKAYISKGLRQDLARLERDRQKEEIAAKLRAHGVSAEVIEAAVGPLASAQANPGRHSRVQNDRSSNSIKDSYGEWLHSHHGTISKDLDLDC